MSIIDDINRTMHHVLTGNFGAAIGDVNRTVGGLLGQSPPLRGGEGFSQSGGIHIGQNLPNIGLGGAIGHTERNDNCNGKVEHGFPPYSTQGSSSAQCCDRYQYSDGFLVDGKTGSVWLFDERAKAFEEVPVRREKSKQALADSLLEAKFSELKDTYEKEMLKSLSTQAREKALEEFEKVHLAPMRAAAKFTLT